MFFGGRLGLFLVIVIVVHALQVPTQRRFVGLKGSQVLRHDLPLQASPSPSLATSKASLRVTIADKLLTSLFKVKPLFKVASGKARSMMIERGRQIGVDWNARQQQYEDRLEELLRDYDRLSAKQLVYPSYYLQPFHAYEEGNLSWQAAMEVESAALTVHAQIYTQAKDDLDSQGDFTLRDNYHRNMRQILAQQHPDFRPSRILDIGCSTGLSTLKLHESFPEAEILALDLSAYMLAVAKYELRREKHRSAQSVVSFLHAKGEDSGLPTSSVDLVALSLVAHELPAQATRAVLTEAHRVLSSGGIVSIMDMDPLSEQFQRFAANPFAFAAFKATEPWIQEYVSLDLVALLRDCGFTDVTVRSNSPRHRTIVARRD